MPGSDRPNVLKVAQSVPGAWPTIPALMRLMSSQATFEPVSAKTQPVSGHTTCQIPDIENSCSRDSSRKTPPSVGSAQFSSPKTRPLPANPRDCRRFSHTWKSHRRDPHWVAALEGFEPVCVDFEPVCSQCRPTSRANPIGGSAADKGSDRNEVAQNQDRCRPPRRAIYDPRHPVGTYAGEAGASAA